MNDTWTPSPNDVAEAEKLLSLYGGRWNESAPELLAFLHSRGWRDAADVTRLTVMQQEAARDRDAARAEVERLRKERNEAQRECAASASMLLVHTLSSRERYDKVREICDALIADRDAARADLEVEREWTRKLGESNANKLAEIEALRADRDALAAKLAEAEARAFQQGEAVDDIADILALPTGYTPLDAVAAVRKAIARAEAAEAKLANADRRRDSVECYLCGGNGGEQVGPISDEYDGGAQTRPCGACHGQGRLDLDAVRKLVDDEGREHERWKDAAYAAVANHNASLDKIGAELRTTEGSFAALRADRDALAERCREYKREWESAVERADSSEHLRKEAEARAEAAEKKLAEAEKERKAYFDEHMAVLGLVIESQNDCAFPLVYIVKDKLDQAEARAGRLAAALRWIADFDDNQLSYARTLHWDMRGKARAALAADTAEKETT